MSTVFEESILIQVVDTHIFEGSFIGTGVIIFSVSEVIQQKTAKSDNAILLQHNLYKNKSQQNFLHKSMDVLLYCVF